jgi:hypothetical protein
MSTPEQEMMVKITRIETQFDGMAADMRDIKQSIKDVLIVRETVAELVSESEALKENDIRLSARLDSHSIWQRDHERWTESAKEKMEGRVDAVRIDFEKRLTDAAAFQNRMRGALIVITVLLSAFGVLSLAVGGWLFTHVNEGTSNGRLWDQRITTIEHQLGIGQMKKGNE